MAEKSNIEWTDATWNPITGCTMVSAGCTNCYAMGLAAGRLQHHPSRAGLTRWTGGRPAWTGEVRLNEQWLDQPLRWKRPRKIFVCAHGDLFHEAVPDEWIDRVFAVMALAPHHTFQVLTKRPERARAYMMGVNCDGARRFNVASAAENIANNFPIWDGHGYRLWDGYAGKEWDTKVTSVLQDPPWPLPNVWLGTSVEDQATADARIPHLLAAPAAVRFLSCEPLLGPVDNGRWMASANVTCKACGKAFWLHEADPCEHAKGGAWTLACPNCGNCRCKPAWTPADARTIDMAPPPDWVDRSVGRFERVHPTIQISPMLDWVICGGESGPGARPMHPDWARSLRDQCVKAGVAFHFKQWGEWLPYGEQDAEGSQNSVTLGEKSGLWQEWPEGQGFSVRVGKRAAGRLLDGRTWDELPGVQP